MSVGVVVVSASNGTVPAVIAGAVAAAFPSFASLPFASGRGRSAFAPSFLKLE